VHPAVHLAAQYPAKLGDVKMNEDKLHIWPVTLAFSILAGIIYLVCALLVWLFPAGTVKFFSYWFHGIDLSKIINTAPINFSAFLIGLLSIIIFSALAGALFAWLYNKCLKHCKNKGWIN